MIDLGALKEQLKLLGHNLPDDQIKNILKDMNIEVDGESDADDDDADTKPRPSTLGMEQGAKGAEGHHFISHDGDACDACPCPSS